MDERYIVDYDPAMKKWMVYDKLKKRIFGHFDIKEHAEQRCEKMNEAEVAKAKVVARNFNKL